MNFKISNVLILIILEYSTIELAFSQCPYSDELLDCLCYPRSKLIKCHSTKDLPSFHEIQFKEISIQETQTTKITTLGDASFEKITIENNFNLMSIGSTIFNDGPKVLVFKNNININKQQLFNAIKNLNNTEIIDLQSNGIEKLDSFMFFGCENVRQIYLQYNKITIIEPNTFGGILRLEDIMLDYNMIEKFQQDSLSVDSSSVSVYISDNKIDSMSFMSSRFFNPLNNMNLYLNNNNMTLFPMDTFGAFLNNNENNIFVSGNKFECSCDDVKWLLDQKYFYGGRVFNLRCVSHDNRDLFRLTALDLKCQEVTTQFPYSTNNSTINDTILTEPTSINSSTTEVPHTNSSTPEVPHTNSSTPEVPHTNSSTTEVPHTNSSTTEVPHTNSSTPEVPHTNSSTTEVPHTNSSTPEVPHTNSSTTEVPHTNSSTPEVPHTNSSTTEVPHTNSSTPEVPHTNSSTTEVPHTNSSTPEVPHTNSSTTEVPHTNSSTTEVPHTNSSTTEVPHTNSSTPEVPHTNSSTTEVPHTNSSIIPSWSSMINNTEGNNTLTNHQQKNQTFYIYSLND